MSRGMIYRALPVALAVAIAVAEAMAQWPPWPP